VHLRNARNRVELRRHRLGCDRGGAAESQDCQKHLAHHLDTSEFGLGLYLPKTRSNDTLRWQPSGKSLDDSTTDGGTGRIDPDGIEIAFGASPESFVEEPVETIYSIAATAPTQPDRRESERYLSLLRVGSIEVGGQRELCLIRNVSAGGMMI